MGETCLNLANLPIGDQKLPLFLKGKQSKGLIALRASWEQSDTGATEGGKRRLRVEILQIVNVRDVGFITSNDVYVDAYCVPFGSQPSIQALPPPTKKTILSASSPNEHVFAFEFLLPSDMPSTIEPGPRNNFCIQYRIEASIDVAFKDDPTCCQFFTVAQPTTTDMYPDPQGQLISNPRPSRPRCIPLCWLPVPCMSQGPILLTARLNRTGHASGERLSLEGRVVNGTNKECKLRVSLMRLVVLNWHSMSLWDAVDRECCGEKERVYQKLLEGVEVASFDLPVGPGATVELVPSINGLRIPPLAPSFHGHLFYETEKDMSVSKRRSRRG